MSMTGKEKLYFLLNRIKDVRDITPSNSSLRVHPTYDLKGNYRAIELQQLLVKLERDEKILRILKVPNRLKRSDNGCYHIRLSPSFDKYYLNIQYEPEYQEFTGKRPPDEQVDNKFVVKLKNTTFTNTPARVVIADLSSIYQEIETDKDMGQFFIKIAHYGKYILENISTITALNPLYSEAKEDAEPYLKSWSKFVRVWKEYAKDILELAEKAGIKDDPANPLSDEIASIKGHLEENETSVWETDIQYYWMPYQTLIWKFGKLNKYHLLIPKHLNPVEPDNKEVVIYPLYQEARDKWDRFKVYREAKVWWAHYQICRLAAGVLGLEIKEQYFKRDNIVDGFYRFEFGQLLTGDTRSKPVVLHKDRYALWVKRLHGYLLPRLEELSLNKAVTHPPTESVKDNSTTILKVGKIKKLSIPPTYNTTSHTIDFRNKEIAIPPNSNQDSLCKVILKNNDSIKKEWNHDEILEKWGGNYDDKEAWRKVYSAGREINKKVAIETGVKDLLIVKKLTTSLNPKYLK